MMTQAHPKEGRKGSDCVKDVVVANILTQGYHCLTLDGSLCLSRYLAQHNREHNTSLERIQLLNRNAGGPLRNTEHGIIAFLPPSSPFLSLSSFFSSLFSSDLCLALCFLNKHFYSYTKTAMGLQALGVWERGQCPGKGYWKYLLLFLHLYMSYFSDYAHIRPSPFFFSYMNWGKIAILYIGDWKVQRQF